MLIKGKGHPQRGVSIYSYQGLIGRTMSLEDCFQDVYDTGSTCFELLGCYVENYPNPSTEWIDNYWMLCEKYKLQPAELGHWAETHLRRGPVMSDEEIVGELIQDFKLANLLGFKTLRTKITCINDMCDPEPSWKRYIEKALPYAEKYDVKMCTEVHRPTTLHTPHIDEEYMEFIERTGTKHFGFNIDFGTFQTQAVPGYDTIPPGGIKDFTKPEEIVNYLPYTYTCHAKFNYVDENFNEVTIPHKEILDIMVNNGWNGFLVSEYEGPQVFDNDFLMHNLSDQIRRHHVMMRNILGY